MDKQIYKHDCDKCVFLGHYHEHDLYVCPNGPTVLGRFGDIGYEYLSGLLFATPSGNDVLYEAKTRAISKGLLNPINNNFIKK